MKSIEFSGKPHWKCYPSQASLQCRPDRLRNLTFTHIIIYWPSQAIKPNKVLIIRQRAPNYLSHMPVPKLHQSPTNAENHSTYSLTLQSPTPCCTSCKYASCHLNNDFFFLLSSRTFAWFWADDLSQNVVAPQRIRQDRVQHGSGLLLPVTVSPLRLALVKSVSCGQILLLIGITKLCLLRGYITRWN